MKGLMFIVLLALWLTMLLTTWPENADQQTPERPPASAPMDNGPTVGRTAPELSAAPRDRTKRVKWYWGERNVCVHTGDNLRSGWGLRWVLTQWNRAQRHVHFTLRESCEGRKQQVFVRQYWKDKPGKHRLAYAQFREGKPKWLSDDWYWRMTRGRVMLNMDAWNKTFYNNGVATPWSCEARAIMSHEMGHIIGLPHLKWNGQSGMVLGEWYDQNRYCGSVPKTPNARPVNTVYKLTRGAN